MEEKIFLHYFFQKVLKNLTLATCIVKDVSLLDQIGPWNGQILLPFKVKVKETNVGFKSILAFGIWINNKNC